MTFQNNFRKGRRGRFIFFPIVAVALALALGLVVMFLWNGILPKLVRVNEINYWQSVGLLVLCRILFGNFGRGGGNRPSHRRGGVAREKWMQMTPEERTNFKQEWRNRCRPKGDEQ